VIVGDALADDTPVTPSGLRKSFCGSVTTSAVLATSICIPGSGSWANPAVAARASIKMAAMVTLVSLLFMVLPPFS